MQAGQHGLAFAVLNLLVSGAVIAITILFAFGYNFKTAKTQRHVCIAAMVLCLKRLVPAVCGATIFFSMNVSHNHWTPAQAEDARLASISTALMAVVEIWALSAFSKLPSNGAEGGEVLHISRRLRRGA